MQYIPHHTDRLQEMFPPEHRAVEQDHLLLRSRPDTDFWMRTHYGFERYNGHVLYDEIKGNFEAVAELQMHPQRTYDQSGIFIGSDPSNWLKTSVEFIPEEASHLGVVVTQRSYSDWSTRNVDSSIFSQRLSFRVRREGNDFFVYFREGSADLAAEWEQLRITHLDCPPGQPLRVGIYSASPMDMGFDTAFYHFEIQHVD